MKLATLLSIPALRFWLLLASLAYVPVAQAQREPLSEEDLAFVEKNWPQATVTSTGLRYVVLKSGPTSGQTPAPGSLVHALYKGMLLNGKVFDENLDPANPLKARIYRGELIDGWDQALRLMRPGDKWLVIIPYELAYGTRGHPPHIPRRATLVFELELLDFTPPVSLGKPGKKESR